MISAAAMPQSGMIDRASNRLKTFFGRSLKVGGSGRLLAMDGLRGLAVTLVFFVHFDSLFAKFIPAGSPALGVSHALGNLGHVGVDLFFVLSGFLIYGGLVRNRPRLLTYLARRGQRIYPTFLAVFVMYLALSFIFPAESKIPHLHPVEYVLANLALLPGICRIQPMMTVAWSLSYEAFFYLTVPLLIDVARLRSVSRGARVAFILALAGVILAAGAYTGDGRVRAVMFAIGIVAYEALESRSFRAAVERSRGAFVLALLAVTVAWCCAHPEVINGVERPLGFAPALFFTALFTLAAPRGITRALSWTPLRWLGGISYSYYLVHGLVLKFLAMIAGRLLHGHVPLAAVLAILAVSFAATLVVAQMLYNAVEYPFSIARPVRSTPRVPAMAPAAAHG